MGQATTTAEGFDTVSQAGSGIVWSGLSNMPYPTEGEGTAALTASIQYANFLYLKVPQEAADIPTGATFDEMELFVTVKKSGTYSSATDVLWYAGTNISARASTWTQTADETYQTYSPGGDDSYWSLTAYTGSEIIEKLKDGTLYFKLECSTTSAIACNSLIKNAIVTITYTTVEGKRAAIIAALV